MFVPVTHRGEPGAYCLTMPVDDDVAMIGGREQFGFPKKIAAITLDRDGDTVVGRVARKGSEILTLEAELTEPADVDQNRPPGMRPRSRDLDGHPCYPMTCFLFKAFMSPNGRRFDYLPRLVREVVLMRPGDDLRTGTGKIAFHSSAQDRSATFPCATSSASPMAPGPTPCCPPRSSAGPSTCPPTCATARPARTPWHTCSSTHPHVTAVNADAPGRPSATTDPPAPRGRRTSAGPGTTRRLPVVGEVRRL